MNEALLSVAAFGSLDLWIPAEFISRNRLKVHLLVPVCIAFSAFSVFLFADQGDLLGPMHKGLTVGFYFGLGNFIAVELRHSLIRKQDQGGVYLWEFWIVSLFGYTLGHVLFFVGDGWFMSYAFPDIIDVHLALKIFVQALPVWFLVCLVIFNYYGKQYLSEELARVEQINRILDHHSGMAANEHGPGGGIKPADAEHVKDREKSVLLLDNSETAIPLPEISHISVEEHYSRIFTENENSGHDSIEVRSSLKELLKQLPDSSFIQVHRSHVVNLEYVTHIDKRHSTYEVALKNGKIRIPLSRRRTGEILPKLEQTLGLAKDMRKSRQIW
jgi:hypothetical protein